MKAAKLVCKKCGRRLELAEADMAKKIAWYACPLHLQGQAEEAVGHTVISTPLENPIDKELVEKNR